MAARQQSLLNVQNNLANVIKNIESNLFTRIQRLENNVIKGIDDSSEQKPDYMFTAGEYGKATKFDDPSKKLNRNYGQGTVFTHDGVEYMVIRRAEYAASGFSVTYDPLTVSRVLVVNLGTGSIAEVRLVVDTGIDAFKDDRLDVFTFVVHDGSLIFNGSYFKDETLDPNFYGGNVVAKVAMKDLAEATDGDVVSGTVLVQEENTEDAPVAREYKLLLIDSVVYRFSVLNAGFKTYNLTDESTSTSQIPSVGEAMIYSAFSHVKYEGKDYLLILHIADFATLRGFWSLYDVEAQTHAHVFDDIPPDVYVSSGGYFSNYYPDDGEPLRLMGTGWGGQRRGETMKLNPDSSTVSITEGAVEKAIMDFVYGLASNYTFDAKHHLEGGSHSEGTNGDGTGFESCCHIIKDGVSHWLLTNGLYCRVEIDKIPLA